MAVGASCSGITCSVTNKKVGQLYKFKKTNLVQKSGCNSFKTCSRISSKHLHIFTLCLTHFGRQMAIKIMFCFDYWLVQKKLALGKFLGREMSKCFFNAGRSSEN